MRKVKVSKAQEVALRKMLGKQWDCAYGWGISLSTLQALLTRGLVQSRGSGATGATWSPRTTIEYRVVQYNPDFVLKMAGLK